MGQVLLYCLGIPELKVDSQTTPLRTRKMMALLAYLSAQPGRHTRDEVAELLWSGRPETARAELRSALYRLQTVLGQGTALQLTRDTVELVQDGRVWVDVQELQRCATDHTTSPDPAAAELWRGPFLQGLTISASSPG